MNKVGKTPHSNFIFNDRPENDFSVATSHITKLRRKLQTDAETTIFVSMVPASFYTPVVQPQSAHFGFSLYCLHHLDRADVPSEQKQGRFLSDAQKEPSFREQSAIDLKKFLGLRATEILPGGSLVLTFTSQADSGEPNVVGVVSSLRDATTEMVQTGEVSPEAAASFHIPVYSRTTEDTKSVLAEVGDDWAVHEHFDEWITHPASGEMEVRRAKGSLTEEDYAWYAGVAVDWGMAVSAGHFEKALQGDGLGQQKIDELMAKWEAKTKAYFLEGFKEQALRCMTTYIRLERKQAAES